MKISTGLLVKVDQLHIPLGSRRVAFQHPESDFPTVLGDLPDLRVGELWIVHLSDRETGLHQHMLVLSKEPAVVEQGLDVEVVRGMPDIQRELVWRLKQAGAPEDVHYTTESRYGGEVVVYHYRWFEVTA